MELINRFGLGLKTPASVSLLLLVGLLAMGCRTTVPNNLAFHDSSRWEKDMAAFEASDRTNPPPAGCIVFVGSSSVRMWRTLAQDFPDLPVVNRGFGGSQIADSVNFAERIIIPYRPRQVLLYAGSNDINSGKDPQLVFGDFVALVKKIRKALPDTQIAYISVNPSRARWKQVEKVKKLNSLAEDYCKSHGLTYINTFPLLLGPDGLPKDDAFLKDGLHMNPSGYAIWREVIKPHLRKQ